MHDIYFLIQMEARHTLQVFFNHFNELLALEAMILL